ncbi:DUF6695 family protein [Psychroserpens sp.]|uniref:DUF6695 family protein n=1 Tax=Psychroserpens sp. TaxID=2020870 RepID=UPI003C75FD0D
MNNAIILTLAYPETIVTHAKEWYSSLLRFIGIGSKKYVRAGHAALVLINKATGILEYHDFGRYITPAPNGRVRGKKTDGELSFNISAEIENDTIKNLDEILKFLATHPKLTHGDGQLYASVCSAITYEKARKHINRMQDQGFITYAAFAKNATNCARFVTDTLIASLTNKAIAHQLKRSKWFTPSTISNVVLANTEDNVFLVSENGKISIFKSTVGRENRRMFFDRLVGYHPSKIGTTKPKHNNTKGSHAQWLGGIAAGAWFELYALETKNDFRFRRISPDGRVDCDGIYRVTSEGFDSAKGYKFIHYSNCLFFHIEQEQTTFKFEFQKIF